MATISFQVAETGQTTLTKTYTLPDANVDLLVQAYQQQANTAINGTATRPQVLQTWVTGLVNGTVQYVTSYQQQAAVAALPPVTPISPT